MLNISGGVGGGGGVNASLYYFIGSFLCPTITLERQNIIKMYVSFGLLVIH